MPDCACCGPGSTAGFRTWADRGDRVLPIGPVWGEDEGRIRLYPDGAVTGVIVAVFTRFAACRVGPLDLVVPVGAAPEAAAGTCGGCDITCRAGDVGGTDVRRAVHTVFPHPACAGVYRFCRAREGTYVAADGGTTDRRRRIGWEHWEVFLPDHHQGYLDRDGFRASRRRIGGDIRPVAHLSGTGAVREGRAVLPGVGRLRGPRARSVLLLRRAAPGCYWHRRRRP